MRTASVVNSVGKLGSLALLFVALLMLIDKANAGPVIAKTRIGGWSAQCEAMDNEDIVCNAQLGPLFYQVWKNEPDQRDFFLAHRASVDNTSNEIVDREYDLISIDRNNYPYARMPLGPVTGQLCYSARTVRMQDDDYDRPKNCVTSGSGLYVEIAPEVWVRSKYLLGSLVKARQVRLRYKEFDDPERKVEIVEADTPSNEWHHHSKSYDVHRFAKVASWCEKVMKNYAPAITHRGADARHL